MEDFLENLKEALKENPDLVLEIQVKSKSAEIFLRIFFGRQSRSRKLSGLSGPSSVPAFFVIANKVK